MKKLFKTALMLAVVLIAIGALYVTVSAATSGNYTYTVTSKQATITDFSTSVSGSISIPSTLGGYPVIAIGDNAFEDCENLTSITIPNSVTTIGKRAFRNCSALTSITIPIGVTTIDIWAFQNCTALPEVNLPISVTTIKDNAFYNCDALKEITIPYSVTKLGDGAFANCNNLTNITVNGSNANYASVDGVLFNKDMTELILYPTGRTASSYQIPIGVTDICEYAFAWCDDLISINIPDGVELINRNAFAYCTNLASLSIPDSVEYVGTSAFLETAIYKNNDNWENDALYIDNWLIELNSEYSGELIIKPGTKGIASYACYSCDSITSISFPDSVTHICDYAFSGCDGLVNLTIPESVISLGKSAFSSCNGLASITLKGNVRYFGYYVFLSCTNLKSVIISNKAKTIGGWAFSDCTALTDVYYTGNATAWNNISIGLENDCLTDATRHYVTSIKITYNANGGTGAPAATTSVPLSDITLSNSVPIRTGYGFLGWAASANATEAEYQAGDTIVGGIENITLYALWKKISFTDTSVTQGSGYKTYQVDLTGIPTGSAVILACYNGDLLTHIEVKDTSDTAFNVPNNISYNEVKVFVWDTLTNISPVTEVKDAI